MNSIVLDANVLYSNILRSLFLWLSWNGSFQVLWSEEIWDEVFRNYSKDNEVKQNFKKNIEEVVFMKFHKSNRKLIKGYTTVDLPDKDDEHVVALARQEKCSTIVTLNLTDFPQEILGKVGISVCSPDLFLCDLLTNTPDEVKESIKLHIKSQTRMKPKKVFYFEKLKKAKAIKFASLLESEDIAGNLFPEIWN